MLRSVSDEKTLKRRADAAWSELKPTLRRIVTATAAREVLELGAGRHPLFSVDEARSAGFSLTVNDIDPEELRQSPDGVKRMLFDVSAPFDPQTTPTCAFDLVFSKMVFEHVRDAQVAWSNVHRLLAPGGVGFAFVPTLYSPPFVLNRLLPERLTSRLVRALDRSRNPAEIPKFPAYYKSCRASETALRPMLTGIGFRDVCVVPFYGTPYFPAVPVLRHLARAFDDVVEKRDWRAFASYAYIIARK